MNEAPVPNDRPRAPAWMWWLVGLGVVMFAAFAWLIVVPALGVAQLLLEKQELLLPEESPRTNSDDPAAHAAQEKELLTIAFLEFASAHSGVAPEALDDLFGSSRPGARPYLADPRDVLDSWGETYVYVRSETPTGWSVRLTTLGRDGYAGGDALDADELFLELHLPRE